jgi:hypothetical protein
MPASVNLAKIGGLGLWAGGRLRGPAFSCGKEGF